MKGGENMTEQKYRVNIWVSGETYEKIIELQTAKKLETQKRVSQGQIVDDVFKTIDTEKGIK